MGCVCSAKATGSENLSLDPGDQQPRRGFLVLLGVSSCSPAPFFLEQSESVSVPREKRICFSRNPGLEEGQGQGVLLPDPALLGPLTPTHCFPEGLCSSCGRGGTRQVKVG